MVCLQLLCAPHRFLLPHVSSFRQTLWLKAPVCYPGLVVWWCLLSEWPHRCWLLHIATEARLEVGTRLGDDRRLYFVNLMLLFKC